MMILKTTGFLSKIKFSPENQSLTPARGGRTVVPMTYQEAWRLAGLGFGVFPIQTSGYPHPNCEACDIRRGNSCPTPQDKANCGCPTCHGFHRASNLPGRVKHMWDLLPDSGIGIATGSKWNIVVLDFDVRDGVDGRETLLRMQQDGLWVSTVSAQTPSGGYHLYYRYPSGMTVPTDTRRLKSQGWHGLDVKSDGGFVVAPPTRKPNKGAYTWVQEREPWRFGIAEMPDALVALVSRTTQPEYKASGNSSGASNGRFHWALQALVGTGRGAGLANGLLYSLGCRAGECVEAGILTYDQAYVQVERACIDLGLDRSGDFPKTYLSGFQRGATEQREKDA